MKIDELALITAWMKKTDLTELLYRKNDDAVNIRTEDAPFSSGLPSCSLSPVLSPAVGVYRGALPGQSGPVQEGRKVESNELLGYIEMPGARKQISSPCAGTVRIACIEDGKAAEYGQPLFFVEAC